MRNNLPHNGHFHEYTLAIKIKYQLNSLLISIFLLTEPPKNRQIHHDSAGQPAKLPFSQ